MNIDLDHLHHWMCAIRSSDDPKRTLDAFWKGQINSKLWLIDNLKPFVKEPSTVEIHGGWVGILSSLMFQSKLPVIKITSIDIDSSCEATAIEMNKMEYNQGKFEAVTSNMIDYKCSSDVVINTSCEHITQQDYETWLNNVSEHTLIVLQSNNYSIDEHIRTAQSLEDFKEQSKISVVWQGQMELPLYSRYMLIGYKDANRNS